MRRLTLAAAAAALLATTAHAQVTIFSDNFDDFEYGPNLQEGVQEIDLRDSVWSKQGPSGWKVDDSAMPAGGVTEWAGWSFADASWWTEVADDDGRSNFFGGTGTIAVADPDEWSDALHDPGVFASFLSSPTIDVSGAAGGSVELSFVSAWQPKGSQTATIRATYDGGDSVEILRWESNGESPHYNPAALDDFVFVNLEVPDDAGKLVLDWGLTDAADDWYWAIDGVTLLGSGVSYYEDFDGVSLGPNVYEHAVDGVVDGVFLADLPAGWTKQIGPDMPGVGDDQVGVREFEGWNFMNKDWWASVAGGDGRETFAKASGGVLVADPDEWNDLGDPAAIGTFDSTIATPAISLADIDADSVQIKFDSSWRPLGDQTAILEAVIDGGDPMELLRWASDDSSPDFHGDSPDESIMLSVANPEGAAEMVLRFRLSNAGDDWWWAIDNLSVTGSGGVQPWPGDVNGDGKVDLVDFNVLKVNFGLSGDAVQRTDGDLNGDHAVDLVDFNELKANFGTSAPVPEPGALALVAAAAGCIWLRARSLRWRSV